MKFNYILILLIVALSSNLGLSQTKEIKIRFIGNCGLHMTDGVSDIYCDFPYKSGAYGYMKYDATELDNIKEDAVFIFTHRHADHYSSKNMRRVIKKKNGKQYGSWNIEDLKKLSESIPHFKIEVFKTKHHFSFIHYSYLMTWHGKKIFLSGDTEHAETIGTIKNMDWAFLPYWLLLDAEEKKIKIDAKMFGIYHLATVQIPSAKETWGEMDKYHPLVEQGEIISVEY